MKKTSATNTKLPVIKAADIDLDTNKPAWLIDSLWAENGVGIIGGHPKSCKSWLGLDLAFSVATGTPALGTFEVTKKGPTLVYLAEDNLRVVKERLLNICEHRQLNLGKIELYVITSNSLRLDSQRDFATLKSIVNKIKPCFLVLDPFVRLHGGDENNAQEVAGLLDSLRVLQRQYKTAIAIVHHARKNGRPNQQGQALRGSGDLWAWGDSNLYLTRQKDFIRLDSEQRAAPGKLGLMLALKMDPIRLEVIQVKQDQNPSISERVLKALENSKLTRTALRQLLAINNKRLGDVLISLEKQGKIKRSSNGWMLT